MAIMSLFYQHLNQLQLKENLNEKKLSAIWRDLVIYFIPIFLFLRKQKGVYLSLYQDE